MNTTESTRPHGNKFLRQAPLPDLVLVGDLARALGISHRAARDWMRHRVPARKIAGRWVAERRDLLDSIRRPPGVCADCCRPIPPCAIGYRRPWTRVCDDCGYRLRSIS